MGRKKTSYLELAGILAQMTATALLAGLAIAVLIWTVGAAFGLTPWLEMPLVLGGTEYPQAGVVLQIILAVFLLALLAYLPSAFRVLKLERSHRDFSVCMSDVVDAYTVSHRADRAGTFTLSSEFDAVKERIAYLRRHPDLGNLEPDVLEAAAEMSYASRELAAVYSDENVARAQKFLHQRQQEIDTFNSRIEHAKASMHELRRWVDQVEVEESVMQSQLSMMESEFGDMLEKLGFSRTAKGGNLYHMPNATAAE